LLPFVAAFAVAAAAVAALAVTVAYIIRLRPVINVNSRVCAWLGGLLKAGMHAGQLLNSRPGLVRREAAASVGVAVAAVAAFLATKNVRLATEPIGGAATYSIQEVTC